MSNPWFWAKMQEVNQVQEGAEIKVKSRATLTKISVNNKFKPTPTKWLKTTWSRRKKKLLWRAICLMQQRIVWTIWRSAAKDRTQKWRTSTYNCTLLLRPKIASLLRWMQNESLKCKQAIIQRAKKLTSCQRTSLKRRMLLFTSKQLIKNNFKTIWVTIKML